MNLKHVSYIKSSNFKCILIVFKQITVELQYEKFKTGGKIPTLKALIMVQ